MSKLVVQGASLTCSFGTSPCSLLLTPTVAATSEEARVATVDDHQPITNIAGFGMCTSLANPAVSAATAAANGVLTPVPCVPPATSRWVPGEPRLEIAGVPALECGSICQCDWGGVIRITDPGTASEVQ